MGIQSKVLKWYDLLIIVYQLSGNGIPSKTTRAGYPAVKITGRKIAPHNCVFFVRHGEVKIGRIKLKHRTWSRKAGSLKGYMRNMYLDIITRLLAKRSTINKVQT